MRKQIQAEHGKAELEKSYSKLEEKRSQQQKKVKELKAKIEAIEKRTRERKEIETKSREAEITYLQDKNNYLTRFIEHDMKKKANKVWTKSLDGIIIDRKEMKIERRTRETFWDF